MSKRGGNVKCYITYNATSHNKNIVGLDNSVS